MSSVGPKLQLIVCAGPCTPPPDYADAMFNLALLLQRGNLHNEAAEYWRR